MVVTCFVALCHRNVTLLFAAVALIPIADMSAIGFLQPIASAIAGFVLGEVVAVIAGLQLPQVLLAR